MKADTLFENEELRFSGGYPSLCRFFKGDAAKPLVVLFPGWAHLARIFYGAPGLAEKDFLVHWLTEKGYSALAVSYPLGHPVYDNVFPGFTIMDWGNLASGIASEVIKEQGLVSEVIALHWSASGQAVMPFNKACSELGIKVRFALGIEPSPAMIIPSDRTAGIKKTKKNLLSFFDSHLELFWAEIKEQGELNGNPLMTKDEYIEAFFGDTPIGILGTNEYFEDGRFAVDIPKSMEDKGFFLFKEYPFVCTVSGNSVLAPYHPLVDRQTWSFLNARKVYHGLFAESKKKMSQAELGQFLNYMKELPDRMCATVPGNHFLFVGESGARGVSDRLESFDKEVSVIKQEIADFLK